MYLYVVVVMVGAGGGGVGITEAFLNMFLLWSLERE